ncbi:aminopeptidase P family protein [Clostridium baratii]|uniref:Metallopeptidase, M24 family n=1 Tax=Clostridium baratii TaxID=1561 RepID=A0A174UQJ0_9CLOT|nr:aminopeptidase P family protein [Clostridium baratii]CUQ22327.1 metallopeptidase%2C M24 family [Clostridium baratii]
MRVIERIEALRKVMKERNIDYVIIPSSDAHQSEYVSDYYKGRAYISGFTGSAGTVLIGLNEGILWTDGRYFIQAENELKGSGIKLFKMRIPGWPTLEEWIFENVKSGETIAFDGKVVSLEQYEEIKNIAKERSIHLKIDEDLLHLIWRDRPNLPSENIFIHDIKYCGKSAKEKIEEVRNYMRKKEVSNYVISSLDDIAWLYNIRGNDVHCNPVVISYAIITLNNAYLYIDKRKVSKEVSETLSSEGIEIKDYSEIKQGINDLKGSVLIDPERVSAFIYENIDKNLKVIQDTNITTNLKAVKNNIEIENLKRCQVRDGVAMVKFIKWLKENLGKIEISEVSASDKLTEFRSYGELFKGISFDTIAGHKEHGAMMHYFPTKESDYKLESKGFLLIDSGGQYLDGTTDITRTIVLGELTEEERRDFTLVLKGHISLMNTKFLKGTSGSNIDIKAREPLWKEGIDYKCGTGHGVGFFLNVHEGPQRISPVPNNISLEPGMILTNEPGIYREGKHGIRTENTMLVVEDISSKEFGEFYKFEVISLCPIDLNGIEVSLLNKEEKEWINEYHRWVFNTLSPYLNEEEKEFLQIETKEI